MQKIFLKKYKDHDLKEEIFRMNQREDESLEDLIERFMYNVKREKLHHLAFDTLKTLLLKTIRDEWIDLLDLMSIGDVHTSYHLKKFVKHANTYQEEKQE